MTGACTKLTIGLVLSLLKKNVKSALMHSEYGPNNVRELQNFVD